MCDLPLNVISFSLSSAAGCTFDEDSEPSLCDFTQGEEDDFDWQLFRTHNSPYASSDLLRGEFLLLLCFRVLKYSQVLTWYPLWYPMQVSLSLCGWGICISKYKKQGLGGETSRVLMCDVILPGLQSLDYQCTSQQHCLSKQTVPALLRRMFVQMRC